MVDLRRSFIVAAVGFAVVVIVSILIAVPSSMSAQPKYSDWSVPQNLGGVVNTAFAELGPHLSKDRKSLYFYTVRPGTGASDIWVTERENVDEESWGPPQPVDAVNTATAELSPSLSRDGHWLFFTRVGALGRDIWMSYREHVHDNLAWQPPVNDLPGINTASDEADPSFLENEDGGAPQLFFNRGNDLYVSSLLPNGTWGPATPVYELNSAAIERGPSVRFDGLEAFFYSNRPNSAGNDLWMTTRQSLLDPWSAPTNLPLVLVNSPLADGEPDISSDRETLYFNSNRIVPESIGGMDLYVTTRTREKQNGK